VILENKNNPSAWEQVQIDFKSITCGELQNFCKIMNRKALITPFDKITFAVNVIIYELAL
jgi:hypothetical protein